MSTGDWLLIVAMLLLVFGLAIGLHSRKGSEIDEHPTDEHPT